MTLPDGLTYDPSFLTLAAQQRALTHLAALPFVHDVFRGQQLKRSYAQFGYAYASTARKLEPTTPLPSFLQDLVARALPHCPPDARLNQCIITRYPVGAGIGWHTDAPRFGDCIAGISLSGQARFQFRPNGTTPKTHELVIAPGSLYVMTGPSRRDYQHQIPTLKHERYSLTLRYVPEGPKQ
jgi:DNA oxidative demethylase